MGGMRNTYKILVGYPEGKSPLGRHRCRWEDNIKMGLEDTRWKILDWIRMDEDRNHWWNLVSTDINHRVP
jgi:hypothetical protein